MRSDRSSPRPTERIALIQQQGGLGIDKGGASNGGSDFSRRAVQPAKPARKGAAEDAFLDPGFALCEFCVGGEAGKFGAGAGAARGAVIGFARALNKIARVGARDGSRAEEFDMIDLRKALGIDCLANTPTDIGQPVRIFQRQFMAVFLREEKPIAQFPADQVGVLADKAQTGALREIAFQQGPGIDIP